MNCGSFWALRAWGVPTRDLEVSKLFLSCRIEWVCLEKFLDRRVRPAIGSPDDRTDARSSARNLSDLSSSRQNSVRGPRPEARGPMSAGCGPSRLRPGGRGLPVDFAGDGRCSDVPHGQT